MKKAIVTGANGFIGKYLIRELVNNDGAMCAVMEKQTREYLEDNK